MHNKIKTNVIKTRKENVVKICPKINKVNAICNFNKPSKQKRRVGTYKLSKLKVINYVNNKGGGGGERMY